MGLKKIFPVIFVLITLSLIGSIYIQINWILAMLQNKQEDLHHKLVLAINNVTQDLVQQRSLATGRTLRLKPSVPWRSSDPFTMELMRVPLVAERYTPDDINDRLRKAFNKQGLHNTRFEFEISSDLGSTDLGNTGMLFSPPELKSKNFFEEIRDTTGKKFFFSPLQAPENADGSSILPDEVLAVVIPDFNNIVLGEMKAMIGGAIFFTLVIIAAFYVTVGALFRQKKLSEIKNDFINNMTHEFKTPLATISLAVDALRNEKVVHDREKSEYFTSIIKEENKRMNKQVETILQASLLDRQEQQLNLKPLHAHDIIQEAMENFHLQLEGKGGRSELQLNAKFDWIEADEVHFMNIITNLIDNAVKYSKESPLIRIITHSTTKTASA